MAEAARLEKDGLEDTGGPQSRRCCETGSSLTGGHRPALVVLAGLANVVAPYDPTR